MGGSKIMGMFDNIRCDFPLPLPLDIVDILPDIYEQEIQTKDLECLMDLYIIDEEGRLLRDVKKYEWKDDDSAFLKGYFEVIESKIVDYSYHGVVNFYVYERIYDDETKKTGKDLSIDFLGKFTNGKLDFIEVLDYTIEDATERIEKTNEFYRKLDESRNIWYNKYIFHTKPVRFIRNKIVRFFYNLHTFTGKLHTLAIRYI